MRCELISMVQNLENIRIKKHLKNIKWHFNIKHLHIYFSKHLKIYYKIYILRIKKHLRDLKCIFKHFYETFAYLFILIEISNCRL